MSHYGIESVRYLGLKIWDIVPSNTKNCSSLNKLKNSIKPWKPNECPCSAFPGDFLSGELGEISVFFAVIVTIFCIC